MSALDPRALRNAFGSFPTGVTVVTALGDDGTPVGFTANSFTSVSLAPPLLLVCPARRLTSFPVFAACARFAVSVLAEGQEDVANTFASFEGDRFAAVSWQPDHAGVPLIEAAAAQFSCRTRQVVEAGDHVLLLGEIDAFQHCEHRGLGYAQGNYFSLGLERAAVETPSGRRRTFAGAIVVHDGQVLLTGADDALTPPMVEIEHGQPVRATLTDWFAVAGVPIRLDKAYSVFDGKAGEHFTFFLAQAAEAGDIDGGERLGRFVPIGELESQSFVSEAIRAMLTRFMFESQSRSFGFYVGDSDTGYVHAMPDDNDTPNRET